MPWINEEMCAGCLVCVGECPSGAIQSYGNVARIDNNVCIRCGVCHDLCPNDAVRHDGELIPQEVETNLSWARQLVSHEYYAVDAEKQGALMKRLERHFMKSMEVARRTLERLPELDSPARSSEGATEVNAMPARDGKGPRSGSRGPRDGRGGGRGPGRGQGQSGGQGSGARRRPGGGQGSGGGRSEGTGRRSGGGKGPCR
ncbi:MAG: 4Fe-4S binding protein [Candidatus Eisenbacteria bacterium]|nr:4Fe-4S binding protein [Candidatus Eisenbacteria bacterium]